MPATAARVALVGQAIRWTTSSDATVKTGHIRARDIEIPTLMLNETDATTENARQFSLMKGERHRYEATIVGGNWQYQVGQTVTLSYPRWGLDAGKDFIITGVREQAAEKRTILKLWG